MANAVSSQTTFVYVGDTASPPVYTEVKYVTSFGLPSGQANEIDATHLQSTAKEYILGLADNGEFTFEGNYISSDTGQTTMLTAKDAGTRKPFKVTLTSGQNWTFFGFVKQFSISGAVDEKISYSCTIRIDGAITRA